MATQKPSKPNVTLPNNFGGVKTPYTQTQIDNGEYCNKIGFFGGYVELLGVVISVGTSTEITKVCHWMVIGMSGTYLDTYLTT